MKSTPIAAERQAAMFEDSEDADDEGGTDVQHYPLPPALLRAAVRVLGVDEVRVIIGARPRKKASRLYFNVGGHRHYVGNR